MVYQTRSEMLAKCYKDAKKRVRKGQRRARRAGFLYLLGIVALAVLACLPLLTQVNDNHAAEPHDMGVMGFYKGFTSGGGLALGIAALYTLMLVILLVNVIRAFGKLGMLCSKKASSTFGFNRPMYAMTYLSKTFTRVFAWVALTHVTIASFANEVEIAKMMVYITLGVGCAIHVLAGLCSFKVGLFTSADGFLGEKREYHRFGSFFRNVVQIALCVFAGIYFFESRLFFSAVMDIKDNYNAYLADINALIPRVLAILAYVVWFFMFKYAISAVEYDIDGRKARGRKRFFWLSVLAAGMMAGILVLGAPVAAEAKAAVNMIAYLSFAAVAAELILMALPRKLKITMDDTIIDTKAYIKQTYQIHSGQIHADHQLSAQNFYML